MQSNKNLVRFITTNALMASCYFAVSAMIMPLNFGMIQLRLAELFAVLPFFNPSLSMGVVIGCLITNFFSDFGIMDITIGTFGTLMTVIFVSRSKKLIWATIWPVVFAIFPAIVISVCASLPFIATCIYVMAGEFLVTVVIGYPLYKALSKNKFFMSKLKDSINIT